MTVDQAGKHEPALRVDGFGVRRDGKAFGRPDVQELAVPNQCGFAPWTQGSPRPDPGVREEQVSH